MEKMDEIISIVEEYKLNKTQLIDQQSREELVVFLCGKSGSGKTAFINALLNREKDEFFTSTKVSTQAIFQFAYGDRSSYSDCSHNLQVLPSKVSERKKLFKTLNEKGGTYTIYLPEDNLKGKIFVDVPGVFDFKRNTHFIEKMFIEADLILFLTPCMSRITAEEYELLKIINEKNIPLIVLFTLADYLDPDEGVTRKTLKKHLENRIKDEFKDIIIEEYYPISSEFYFKDNKEHGIDKFINNLNKNKGKYLKMAKEGRINRIIDYYIDMLEKEINNLSKKSNDLLLLIKRKWELWEEEKKEEIKEKYEKERHYIDKKLTNFQNECRDQIIGYMFTNKGITETKEKRFNKFKEIWNNFWDKIVNEFSSYLSTKPQVPYAESNTFEKIKIRKETLDKFERLLLEILREKKDWKKVFDNLKMEDLAGLGLNTHNLLTVKANLSYYNEVKKEIEETKEDISKNIRKRSEREKEKVEREAKKQYESEKENSEVFELLQALEEALERFNNLK